MPVDGPGEVTVRTHSRGGGQLDHVRELHGTPRGEARITLFIHGYANNHHVACSSYQAMDRSVQGLGAPRDRLNRVWWFYWPGDLAAPVLSQASYPFQISSAKKAARALSDYLVDVCADSGRSIDVAVVAHSLGNRVALETAKRIEESEAELKPRVTAIVLMAAAVPERMCRPNKAFERRDLRRKEIVLFSRRDTVLRFAFPVGQTAALEGFFPKAVGYEGRPSTRWDEAHETGYRHGDYWGEQFSSTQVARVFGIVAPWRVEDRTLVEWESPPPNVIGVRNIQGAGGDLCSRRSLGKYEW